MQVRAKRHHTFFTLGIPGPNNPVDIQSFFLPFYKAMAKLSGGLWMWDVASRKWFVWKGWLINKLGDMLGSAKANGCTGHQGKCGCRFCKI
ncbi:hypothetical protein BT69DRAFT_1223080, partial [Atractiella rhizophila]